MKITKEYASDGGIPPRYYGWAYRDLCTNTDLYYPIPFHLLVRFGRAVRHAYRRTVKYPQWFFKRSVWAESDRDYLCELARALVSEIENAPGRVAIKLTTRLTWEIVAKLRNIAERQ